MESKNEGSKRTAIVFSEKNVNEAAEIYDKLYGVSNDYGVALVLSETNTIANKMKPGISGISISTDSIDKFFNKEVPRTEFLVSIGYKLVGTNFEEDKSKEIHAYQFVEGKFKEMGYQKLLETYVK